VRRFFEEKRSLTMKRSLVGAALVSAYALLAAAPVAAAVVQVSADRFVGAGVLGEDLSETVASSSFGLFDESVSAELFIPGTPFPTYDFRADASQTSTLQANGVIAVGQAHSDGVMTPVMCVPCWPGSAASTLEWTFDVTSPTHLALSGTLETEVTDLAGLGIIFSGEVTARVRLEDVLAGGAVISEFESVPTSAIPCCESVNVAASGTLPVGRYRLVVENRATLPIYLALPWGSLDASSDVTLTLINASVPVPDVALGLVAAGLLGFGIYLQRRRSAAEPWR
jgi:hypothetical protein